ncbi:hypothetical protein BD289DRAFT_450105 [Coniella lustricola]|uniref:Ams2/SPT21 N-terminal domain-containing protein n=1 Tax=Coniella lustricola TaxID=2025994 RepID=A0A2T3AJT5_9PEZI|nr:hypothetical protein BD289DRAFT_450105 [Coniella lustricola]
MTAPHGGAWLGYPPNNNGHPSASSQPSQAEDMGLQTRHMGLKVQYTFEKDQQNCLAKWPHVLQIRTIPLDERCTIGVVDLRVCLQAIEACSPEIINRPDKDYAVYALDYSEEDTPLVGQGMLSWGLEQPSLNSDQKMVTGKVVKNMLAALRGGPPETLEVRLKLNSVPKMQRPQTSQTPEVQQRGYGSNAPTPTPIDTSSEWSSFVQSNANMGRPANGPPVHSPGLPPVRYGSPIQALSPAPESRPDMYSNQHCAPTPPPVHAAPVLQQPQQNQQQLHQPGSGPGPGSMSYFQPTAVPVQSHGHVDDSTMIPKPDETAQAPRPKTKRGSSKASKKKSTGSGKMVGRPRKHDRSELGHTSAMEDGTDAEEALTEGPKKKRAKTTKAEYPSKAPLSSATGSLRVAASTSGSLRTMRPAAAGVAGVGLSHLQEVPRAPTPVPGQQHSQSRGRPLGSGFQRTLSMAESDGTARPVNSEVGLHGLSNHDARSPDSTGQSPYQAYTPEDSPADIGSSPPVPRSARSSLPPSSPVLPPMRMPQPDSGFMSGGFDDSVEEYDMHPVMPTSGQVPSSFVPGKSRLAPKPKLVKRKTTATLFSHNQPRPMSSGYLEPLSLQMAPPMPLPLTTSHSESSFHGHIEQPMNVSAPQKQMVIQHEHPGSQELLPKKSIYNFSASAKAQAKKSQTTGTTRASSRQLKRANTEPVLQRQDTPSFPSGLPPMPQPPTKTMSQKAVMILPQPTKEPPSDNIATGPAMPQPISHQDQALIEKLPADLEEIKTSGTEVSQTMSLNESTIAHSSLLLQIAHPMDVGEPMARTGLIENEVASTQSKTAQQTAISQPIKQTTPAESQMVQTAPSSESSTRSKSKEVVKDFGVPTPGAAESTSANENHLLQLLGEPVKFPDDIGSRLSPVPELERSVSAGTQRPESDAGHSGLSASNPADSPSAGMPEDSAQPSKNMSRKQSIRDKLEKAVAMGQMPTFCSNCGSISTPTWRKIWTQELDGSPEIPEYSEKPGRITAIVILSRNENGTPTRYRVVKKTLGTSDDKSEWVEDILCNPCGLWLSKYQTQRPESQWEKDFSQIGKPRKKRAPKASRSKKTRTSMGAAGSSANLTSEAYFTTDPIMPEDQGHTPFTEGEEVMLLRATTTEPPSRERGARSESTETINPTDGSSCQDLVHLRNSDSARSPVALGENDMGTTKRLLFPSPKKDGQPKVLGEVAVNIVRTSVCLSSAKSVLAGMEKLAASGDLDLDAKLLSTPKAGRRQAENDGLEGLFGTPVESSTLRAKEKLTGVFKTPTRPTPSHRPITRSVSKSICTARSMAKSPGHALARLQQTPTKTPRSSARLRNANAVNNQQLHAHLTLDDNIMMTADFGTPFNSTITQLLSEANDFTADSSAHGLYELPDLGSETNLTGHFEGLDFGHFLTTDAVIPSSPPVLRKNSDAGLFGSTDLNFDDWDTFQDVMNGGGDGSQTTE